MTKRKHSWFEVSKEGLSKLVERKGKSFILFELLQNAWDQDVTNVHAEIWKIPGRAKVNISVSDDDPDGFRDITHAFTLFAESDKKSNPSKRGRFNLGEKLVLACCDFAEIQTTTGAISFHKDGSRTIDKRHATTKGSIFFGTFKMNQKEFEEVCREVSTLIPPPNVITTFNVKKLENRKPIASFKASLPTEISDSEGNLKKTVRKTVVNVYEPKEGEKASIYEMGIPVVELTGDKYHIDIQQKIPLNMDRDNVTPKYLSTIRTEVLNQTIHLLDAEDASSVWVKAATSNEKCSDDAINKSLDLRFGKKRVIFDPSDPEANKKAASAGYTVIPGKSLSKDEWANVKRSGAALPAGKVTPSSKVLSSPNGQPPIPNSQLTIKQRLVKWWTVEFALKTLDIDIAVKIIDLKTERHLAWYGNKTLTFNLPKLGKSFFENFPNNIEDVIDLVIHELGHEYSSDHLSEEYYRALTMLGAKSTMLALKEPEFFNRDK
jgi:hypothetical protein